jgi:serine phosphatase RsbU (regulator of sigma subunit)
MKEQDKEVMELRRTVRDLLALSTMPTVWIGYDTRQLAEGVLDLLFSTLRLDVAYIRIQGVDQHVAVEAWRGRASSNLFESLRHVETSTSPQKQDQNGGPGLPADLAADRHLRISATQLGVQSNCGTIVAGCSRADFPNSSDKLLLSVAANQTVIAFQLEQAKTQLAQTYNELRITQEKELKAAAFIQQRLMVARLPQSPFVAVMGKNLPCKEVGGDFFTVDTVDKGVVVAVADISGKGTSAAIMASLLQGMIQADWQVGVPLPEIARSANNFFCHRELDAMYATLVIACVQPDGTLEYINCGHIPPIVVTQSGEVVWLRESNVPVGLLPDAEFMSAGFRLSPGEHFIVVTDGVTEAESPDGEFFGESRLEKSASRERPLEEIFASVHHFCAGTPLRDDCTVVELAYLCKRDSS